MLTIISRDLMDCRFNVCPKKSKGEREIRINPLSCLFDNRIQREFYWMQCPLVDRSTINLLSSSIPRPLPPAVNEFGFRLAHK